MGRRSIKMQQVFGLDREIASLAAGKLGAIPARGVALAGLLLFAISTTLAMSAVAAGLGRALRALPAAPIGGLVCVFGLWYVAAAAAGARYPF
jgi:hypothetical protein